MPTDNQQSHIKQLINEAPLSGYQVLVVLICFVLNFNDGIDVLLVSFTAPSIAHSLGLSQTQLGYIFSAGLAGMTAGCFLLAPLADRIGRRPVFIISLFTITTGMLLVYFSDGFGELLLLRCLTGFGIGGILPNLATIAAEFSNQKTRDFNVGIVQGGWPLGAILTGFVTSKILPAYGWKFTYLVSGSFSLLMLLVVVAFLPESPMFLLERRPKKALSKLNAILQKIGQPILSALPIPVQNIKKVSVAQLFTKSLRTTTLLLWLGIFLGFLTLYTVLSWVPNLAKESGMPMVLSIYLGTTLNLGAFTGVFVMGLSIGKFGIKRVMAVFMTLAFTFMMVFGTTNLFYMWKFALIFLIGFFVQGGFNTFYPASSRIYPESIRATGIGWAMGIGRFGAIIGPTLFGMFHDMGFSIALRFAIFSVPLLLAAVLVYKIPSRNMEKA